MFIDECDCNASRSIKGIEGNLLNEVAKKMNFIPTYVIAHNGVKWGWIYPSPQGAVGEVFTGRSDFAIGLLAPTIERFENLDISLPYNGEECITYGVPTGAGATAPYWITILFFEFSFSIWLLIIISFLALFAAIRLIAKISKKKWLPSASDIILYTYSSYFGLPIFIPKNLPFRIVLLSWILFAFIVTLAYKSSMGSRLTVPHKDPDINTFNELLQSKLQLTGYKNMLRLLQVNDTDPTIQKMINRFKVTDYDIDSAVELISSERKIAYVRHTTTFLYYALINPKVKGHIHIIKDCILVYHPSVITKKNSPFSYRLNQIISRLMESGLTKKWRSEYIYNFPPSMKSFLKLSTKHMYGVFCILTVGHIISFVFFIIEIAHFKFFEDP